MESVDSSPNYMRARSRFDANKENSSGGSECDEIMSVGSSNGGSAVNGPYTRKLSKKALKNIRSFRRRPKPRVVQSPVPLSDEESFIGSSQASPHYLKATTSSRGKKTRTQASPLHTESTFDVSDKNTSHSSQPKLALSRTSSLRNVRILIKRTSFKPKRSLLRHSKASDVGIERATYSSTLKDSKFPVPVELHHRVEEEPEKSSAMKVCHYHHCSLHGHCHGSDDPTPPLQRFLYKRRQSLKKQWSIVPKTESVLRGKQSNDRKNLRKRQIVPEVEVELLNEERFNDSIAVSGVKNMNGLDSHEGNYHTEEIQLFGDGYKDFKEPYLVELAFGETSFPERSYQDNLSIVRKYSLEEQDFGGRKGYCSTCSCHVEEVATTARRAKVDLNSSELSSSRLDGINKEIPQNGPTVDSDTNLLASFKKPKEAVDVYIEDIADTPVLFDETENGSAVSSASSNIQTSTGSNSEEEAESTTESLTTGDSKVNEVARVEDSETNTPTHDGGILHFSKPRHMSMWNLIHLHMSSNLPVEPTNKLIQGTDGESPVDGSSSVLAKDSTDLSRESSDTGTNDSEIQEIELRKLFAVKLVREAIEKILLPEVQDQASYDQSIASESTPRAELVEINQAFAQENDAKSDAERVNGDISSDPKEDTVGVGDASGGEIKEAEEQVVRKSEKKAPKHWSNLKKWILLQRFFKELEKVRKFNPRKPRHLPLNHDPEAEKVNLRPQTLDGRKSAEEWMLDHALRQAVSQLAPTQKKKVALLVKAFETVVPPQEDSQVQFKVPRVTNSIFAANGNSTLASVDRVVSIFDSANKDMNVQMVNETEKAYKVNDSSLKFQFSTDARNEDLTSNEKCMPTDLISSKENGGSISKARSLSFDVDGMLVPAETSSKATKAGNAMADFTETEAMTTVQGLQDAISDSTEGEAKNGNQSNQMDTKNHIKMWHMIYQHVVSGIAEKVGREILEGEEEDEAEDDNSSATNNSYRGSDLSQTSDALREENHTSSNVRSGLTKSDAVKLVKEAVDEILLPEIEDDASDTQSVTSESDIPERNLKAEAPISKKSELSKSKNWSKLKKLILLKRSIKALREFKAQPHQLLPQTSDPEPEKVDLRQRMMDERKKAEQWMLDYAVQHIITKLTPARKRRVFMLVEAFEAVVPFPEI